MLCTTTSPQDTLTVNPELSAERANYLAAQASALRQEFDLTNPGAQRSSTQGASTPVPNLDELAAAFAFLSGGSYACRLAVAPMAQAQTWVPLNYLDFGLRNDPLISFEFSSGSQGWAYLDAAVSGFLTGSAGRIRQELVLEWQKSLPSELGPRAVEAPPWLVQRMKTLRQMPPPTSQEVETQLKASAEVRKKLTDRLPVWLSGQSNGKRS